MTLLPGTLGQRISDLYNNYHLFADFMKEHPEHPAEARQTLQFLYAQKMGDHEAEIEKIKSMFLSILRDIKKDIDKDKES